MKKLFQTEWQNISFSSFHKISSTALPSSEFYDAFYSILFEKYPNYDALDAGWRFNKDELTDWLASLLPPDKAKVLSIGCGLGYVEQRLLRQHGSRIELHVQDYSSRALHWIKQVLPPECVHVSDGDMGGGQFDFIYLSAVDYALCDEDLVDLLVKSRQFLCAGGELMLISASFLEEAPIKRLIGRIKDAIKYLLDVAGIRHRGQLWGWMRSRDEYRKVMRKAGFLSITDGFLETNHQRTYWIKGRIHE